MTTSRGFQGTTQEWRWPVVDTTEPKHVRTVQGYVTILGRITPGDDMQHVDYTIFFSNKDGQPLSSMNSSVLWMYHDAAAAALGVLGVEAPEPEECSGDIIR